MRSRNFVGGGWRAGYMEGGVSKFKLEMTRGIHERREELWDQGFDWSRTCTSTTSLNAHVFCSLLFWGGER